MRRKGKPYIGFGGRSISDLLLLAREKTKAYGIRYTLYLSARYIYRYFPVINLVSKARARYLRKRAGEKRVNYRRWYRTFGRQVTVVVPTFGNAYDAIQCVKSIQSTTDPKRVSIVVTDDCGPEEDCNKLKAELTGVELLLNDNNVGFSGNLNRVINGVDTDIVVVNSDIVAHKRWLEPLQYTAFEWQSVGIVAPMLLYPDGLIQSAGSHLNYGGQYRSGSSNVSTDSPARWFDHRYRFTPRDYGPAQIPSYCLSVTGACMYIKKELIDEIGSFDEGFGLGFEDADICIRAWNSGFRVAYQPHSVLTHLESATRGYKQSERELMSLDYFWRKWSSWIEDRHVIDRDGNMQVIYCTQDCGVGGGHRVIFEHLNRLNSLGVRAMLYTLKGPPQWFNLDVPVKVFKSYRSLIENLSGKEAIKVATWWQTAPAVWLSSVVKGVPVYLVQDIESSYYKDSPYMRQRVQDCYRREFKYLTISSWNVEQLKDRKIPASKVSPGIDLETFKPEPDIDKRKDVILTLGRGHYLKNLDLTLKAWRAMSLPRPQLWMFGVEPELGKQHGARYFYEPDDQEVNRLLNQATVFCQTSSHEGFCLPILEAMAAGTPVVCTNADGNLDFCVDGVNCLMPEADSSEVRDALEALFADEALRERLVMAGFETAKRFGWDRVEGRLLNFYKMAAQQGLRAPEKALVGG